MVTRIRPPKWSIDCSDRKEKEIQNKEKEMKLLKWLWELVNELAEGLTQNGRTEILPDDTIGEEK